MFSVSSLKSCTKHMVERVGGQAKAAQICEVSQVTISNWCSDEAEHVKDRISVLALLKLSDAADDMFLHDWVQARGYEMKSSKDRRAIEHRSMMELVGELSKAVGVLVLTILKAFADGVLCNRERRDIRDKMRPAKTILSGIDRVL